MLTPFMDFKAERQKAYEQFCQGELTFQQYESRIITIGGAEIAHDIDCDIVNELLNRDKPIPFALKPIFIRNPE